MPAFLLALVLSLASADAVADSGFSVSGRVTGYLPGHIVYLALYDSEENFKATRFSASLRFTPDKLPSDTLEYRFKNIKPGEYMIACFQDLNGDRKINIGFFGPTEPYATYRSTTGMFGPKFGKCRFAVDRDIASADMSLK